MIRALFLVLILTILGTIPSSANLVQMPTSAAAPCGVISLNLSNACNSISIPVILR
jgi:hypothetical protein